MKKFLFNWLPVVLFFYIIFYLSSTPIQSHGSIPHLDLVGHAGFYGILAMLLTRAVNLTAREKKLILSIFVIFIATLYGAFIEWYQGFIPSRFPSISDGIANFIGACLGTVFYIRLYRRWKRRKLDHYAQK